MTARPVSARSFSRLGKAGILVLAGLFFVLPFAAMTRFALQNVQVIDLGWSTLFDKWSLDVFTNAFGNDFFLDSLVMSTKIAIGTVLLTLLLLVPTAVWVHLKLPRARAFVEFLTVLPYVIPAIGLVAGIIVVKPHVRWFISSDLSLIPFYVVLALPFTYRAIDTGLQSIDLKTLTEAARNLGAGWFRTLFTVIAPNLRSAIIASTFLTIAVVLGEFTIADVLLKRTFPAFMAEYRQSDPRGGYALAVLALGLTTLLFIVLAQLTRPRRRIDSIGTNTPRKT
ncbi:MAG: ABC transporter permease [Acidimicrobiales bacterium mtb01]|nr:ABC transporter permease subunit [Actinomycetota bacterium]TEX48324.1 MAG: ABC transporter permease [Acidimicrobiales bacterium mtb01]